MTKVLAALTLLLSCTVSQGAQVAVAAAQSSSSLLSTTAPQTTMPARARASAVESIPVAPLLATCALVAILGFRRKRTELFR